MDFYQQRRVELVPLYDIYISCGGDWVE